MQKSKLGLDFTKVAHAKDVARNIAVDVQSFVEQYTTVAVERTLCRLLGIDGVDENTVPLPNVLVSSLQEKGVLGQGILFYLGNAIAETGKTPQQVAESVSAGELDLTTHSSRLSTLPSSASATDVPRRRTTSRRSAKAPSRTCM